MQPALMRRIPCASTTNGGSQAARLFAAGAPFGFGTNTGARRSAAGLLLLATGEISIAGAESAADAGGSTATPAGARLRSWSAPEASLLAVAEG